MWVILPLLVAGGGLIWLASSGGAPARPSSTPNRATGYTARYWFYTNPGGTRYFIMVGTNGSDAERAAMRSLGAAVLLKATGPFNSRAYVSASRSGTLPPDTAPNAYLRPLLRELGHTG